MTRTWLFDQFIVDAVRAGADLVVNLAAGLDTRPYRMDLPKTLRWVEVDLPGILDYKERVLGGAAPVCLLERVRQDLADERGRRALFARLGESASNAVVVSEGLLIYLTPEQVTSLAADLAAVPSMRRWITDLVSPALMKMMTERGGQMIAAAGAPFHFAPREGPDFFAARGWQPARIESMLKTAGRLNRLPMFLKMISMLPESRRNPNRPWSAVISLVRA